MAFALLPDRAVIALKGEDTRAFLQGLITNDMEQCRDGTAIYAGLLTPQGKLLFDFFVAEASTGTFLLDCASARAADLTKRLTLYRLRSKVEIAPSGLAVAALWDVRPEAPGGTVSFADPRLPELGIRVIGPEPALRPLADGADYTAHRLALGVPDGGVDFPPDQVFALDAGFEELNGVSFKKGCYVGQEVTARMKHRATARRRFVIVEGELPPAGTAIKSQDRELGTLASGTSGRALALVRLDRLEEAAAEQAPISAGGHVVSIRKPAWMSV